MITSIESADDLFGMESYHKLVLTMLTIIIFCIRVWTMTTVWYNFQANTCSNKAAPGCFGFTGAQRCCGGSSHEFCGKFNLAVVGGSETQTTEKRTLNCSCITITKYYQWSSSSYERSWHLSHCITIPRNHELMRTFCSKGIIVVLSFLKAGFKKRKSSAGASNLITAMRTNPTWLIFCLRKTKDSL